MIEHVENVTRKIAALEKIHDLMADALEDISLEMAQLRKEIEAQVQPPLPGIGEDPQLEIHLSHDEASEPCLVCGHPRRSHTAYSGECCYPMGGCKVRCQKFVPANKAGK